ncbi:anhydro-N-acetylmuramic acid kinase [Cereibacter azotoformans]|uniref:Anhydro-N-acetylmuramic acid kinase n=1 Tax=Cereibacter azotoformans TaxID=43057 RepID=A0A2T5JWS4_9RHOB|nr:anhydro-N-acetylmuramic acid kinase [Cereibacter azotoformans]AXQ93039.1 anhydro-N-acetylmuramic acid kinase [Cereibacter sphaeroides]MBO4169267.1 anhydro-N-acetylmuramic acid kinase [Cereibacter azotoformans]PTR14633.1 anhydro-N-acetylmuramic acid kinase [Cereibacter azotoformans]UIJ31344.1 anhydro-N-acetylmuramic acid kinase [Cereibacter azotoformans]ULB09162.1 anhydro-N-acetylmuramic acid kinase [Cereibacter azotoformans]
MLKGGAVWALGTMSGTSLDGVDAAMVLTDGERILEFGATAYRPYSGPEREVLRTALGRWPGEEAVAAAEQVVEAAHAELLARFRGAELVGFHGQTLAHEPGGRGTHQAGSGERLARALGLPVVWDFRSADVQAGGQGAPLAPFYHFACARRLGAEQPVAFLNLGGVGNLTWVDPRQASPEAPGACLAFDTGPANAPINDLMQARFGRSHDEGGRLAARGQVAEPVVERFLGHAFFARMPPKSLDRDAFADLLGAVEGLADADAAATLTAAAAAAVARGAGHFPTPVRQLLVTGGGRRNPVLMAMLESRTGIEAVPVEQVGLDGDMLEAQAFAYLAVRVARGLPTSGPATTGVSACIGGGRISRPEELALEG